MAQLIVRNLEAEVKQRLVERARRHGRSMEEEVRDILRTAVREDQQPETGEDFGMRLASYFAGLDLPEIREFKGEKIRPITFDDDE
jgi:plasmid stability protein